MGAQTVAQLRHIVRGVTDNIGRIRGADLGYFAVYVGSSRIQRETVRRLPRDGPLKALDLDIAYIAGQ